MRPSIIGGVVTKVYTTTVDTYLRITIGRPDGQFVELRGTIIDDLPSISAEMSTRTPDERELQRLITKQHLQHWSSKLVTALFDKNWELVEQIRAEIDDKV